MAYYNGFPATYQPMYQQNYQPPYQINQQNTAQSGFVRVQTENEARMYPVAPGNSVTFINENEPYCYTKSVDVSQLDRPKFEKYRLVKEDPTDEPQESYKIDTSAFALKDDVSAEIKRLEKKIDEMSVF